MGLVNRIKFEQYFYDIFELLTSGPIIEKKQEIHQLIDIHKYGKENLAHTLQKWTEDKIKEHVYPLKTCDNLCMQVVSHTMVI